jgi:hypothetical protein
MKYILLLFLSVFGLAYSQEKSTQTLENRLGARITASGSSERVDLMRATASLSPEPKALPDVAFPPWDNDSTLSPNSEVSPTPSLLVDSEKIKHIAQAEQKAYMAENEYANLSIKTAQAKMLADHLRSIADNLKTGN